jgi:transposase
MNATTVAVDLAKTHFELAMLEGSHKLRSQRLTRRRLEHFLANLPPCRVVMEACGSAHHWARTLQAQGHEVRLLPPQYVRAYVRRSKTDAADAAALLEADRCPDMPSVPVKSVDQQALLQLHRLRQQYQRTRTARINQLRGCFREFGIDIPVGIERGIARVREELAIADNGLPQLLRPCIQEVLQELSTLKERIGQIEHTLGELTRQDPIVRELQSIPGVGVLSATALRAAVGNVQRFPSGRHFACWLGLTAREHSSGERRRLGSISKQGDVYLRTLLIHGARSALLAAQRAAQAGRPLDRLRSWALQLRQRCGWNKASVALANKLARIIWATWRHERAYDGNWALSHAPHA